MEFTWKDDPAPSPVRSNDEGQLATVTPIGAHVVGEVVPTVVEHAEDLPTFSRKLYDVIDLQPSLRHRLCPVDVSGEGALQTFAILLMSEELNTELTAELVKKLEEKGWRLAQHAYYVASRTVLFDLARDGINDNKRSRKNSPGTRKQDSALWHAFEAAAIFALENNASDIHVQIDRSKPNSQIKFRIDGRLTKPRQFEIDSLKLLDMVAYLYNVYGNSGSENTFNENKPQQCQVAATIKQVKLLFRWASNKTATGTTVVMRVIRQDNEESVWTLEQLGYLPPQVMIWKRAIRRLGGGIVVGGVVGSGKSKTLQTVMSLLPDWMAKYTAEDPVENLIPGASQFSVSRSLTDSGTDPFLAIKRQTKRMDPDAVMIGEIRDSESAGLFRDIAESGHRAISTVHAPSAIDMVTLRLVSSELGIPRDVIATPGFINLLVYQALVPKLCGCKVNAEAVYDGDYLARVERLFAIKASQMKAVNAEGCDLCRRKDLPELNGSKGRIVVAEMIELTPKMLLLFRESKNLELKRHIKEQRTARFDEPDSTGKSALEVAMYHVAHGIIDPQDVEEKFGSFEQYELEQENENAAINEALSASSHSDTGRSGAARRIRVNFVSAFRHGNKNGRFIVRGTAADGNDTTDKTP